MMQPHPAPNLLPGPRAHVTGPSASTLTPSYEFSLRFQPTNHGACNESRLWLRGGTGADGRRYLDADLVVVNRCRHDPAQQFLLNAYFRTNSFELNADPHLTTATLTGTLPVVACNGALCEWVGQSLYVEVTLTGSDEPAGDPGSALSRFVVATGTVAGRWENFAADASVEGYLSRLEDERVRHRR
jgi:hypothetical protein